MTQRFFLKNNESAVAPAATTPDTSAIPIKPSIES